MILDALTLWWSAGSPPWTGKLWILQSVCWWAPSPGHSPPTAKPPPWRPDSVWARNANEVEKARIRGVCLVPTQPLTVPIGPRCSLYWPPIGSRYRPICCPQRPCCWPRCPEKSCERSCCRCPSLPSRLPPALGTAGSLLWWRHTQVQRVKMNI